MVDYLGPNPPFGRGLSTQTGAISVTNSTANQTLASATVAANDWAVGAEYQFEGLVHVSRGATATAANLVIELLVGGSVVRTLTIVIPTGSGSNRMAHVFGWVTCLTTGSSGTCQITLRALQDLTGSAGNSNHVTDPAPTTAPPAATTVNTTISRAIEVRARMSAAVASLTMYCTHPSLARVR